MEKREYTALQLTQCLAKTYTSENNIKCAGRTVLEHCRIVGEIAHSLIQRHPDWLKFLFPSGSELIAAAHDIGKVSPTFQEKIYRNINDYSKNPFPELKNINPDIERNWGGHAGVSQLSVKFCSAGNYIPEILGQHHGYSPNVSQYYATDEVFGDKPWQRRREELLVELKKILKCDWPKVCDPLHARILAGLTTVADWIGSGSQFDNPTQEWSKSIESAIDAAGFIKPKLRKHLNFYEIFGFEHRISQDQLIQSCITPGIYILEAPMGIGKTEAAFYSAYKLMSTGKATGIYFALPTQLTSNKIHERMNLFLEKILETDCCHRNAFLLHSNAWLQNTEIGEEGQPGGSWFQSSKRGILAPFGVGTVDQALMAVMNVKHGFVRTFGLAGKVVILDEVHSYDAYTGTILNTLVEALAALHCTVIILSATLTKQRRRELFIKQSSFGTDQLSNDYPLISALPMNENLREIPVNISENEEVALKLCQVDEQAIQEALSKAESGQYVLWIENTVNEAQSTYKLLASRSNGLNVSCGLLHSRFLKQDRENLELFWISLFGKDSKNTRGSKGYILVGTQVVEQSIDIDADFIITRMCPTDMLLQRLGRLWRHKETARAGSAIREAWILAPTLNDTKKKPEHDFGKTALVYSPYVLYRSLEVWSQVHSISLPSCIRSLIEETYEERAETGKMLGFKNELNKYKEKLQRFALVGISRGGTTLSENQASTRYSEQDSVEVLLIRSCHLHKKGADLILLDGKQLHLPKNSKILKKHEWRKLAIILQSNTVKVVDYLAPKEQPRQDLFWLEDYLYLGNKDFSESLLRVAEVRDSDELGVFSEDYELTYNSTLGYQARKRDKKNE